MMQMTNDDERGGRGVKNAQNLMTSYVNDPLTALSQTIPGARSGTVSV